MENYNRSTLPVIFIIYSAACLLGSLSSILSWYGIPKEVYLSMHILITLVCIGMIAWGAVSGKRIGVSTPGCIGGWIYIPFEIICFGTILYNNYLFQNYDWNEAVEIVKITGIAIGIFSFFSIAGLSMFVLGSRAWLPIKIILPAGLFLIFILSLVQNYIIHTWMLNLYISPILYITVLALSIVWKIKSRRP